MEYYASCKHDVTYGAYDVYSSPPSGDYTCRGYRAIVEDGVVSKNWFDQSGWTQV
ncbi:MAG: hypothetical protein PWP08_488 [Methanofollis sp.]|nr:hypothetical protein [Methanofollis sp.]